MHRVEVILPDTRYQALEQVAAQRGRSVAEVVTEIVEDFIDSDRSPAVIQLEDIEGIGADPEMSGADHDAVLYGAPTRA